MLAQQQWDKASDLFKISPDVFTATLLISYAHKNLGNLSKVWSTYTFLTNKAKPDSFLYTALVGACHKLGAGDHISTIWHDMIKNKYLNDAFI